MPDTSTMTDSDIVTALLRRDEGVTRDFFFRRCYPLFKSIYSRYYTDCESVVEFIGEIYLYVLTPGRELQVSKLAGFGFRCSLTMWLKVVTENYCRHIFTHRIEKNENIDVTGDRFEGEEHSFTPNISSIDASDVAKVLAMMPNERYRSIIDMMYLQGLTNEETAKALGMNMMNFYNKHRLAKEQFCRMLRKEGLI